MDYVIQMTVAYSIDYWSDGISCFFFRIMLFLNNAVKELSARH